MEYYVNITLSKDNTTTNYLEERKMKERIKNRKRIFEVMETMIKLNREEGLTVINITHFMEEAVLADRVVVMENGHIVLQGTPREIFTQIDVLKNLHLDVPVMTELAAMLHANEDAIPQDVLSIDEMVVALCR